MKTMGAFLLGAALLLILSGVSALAVTPTFYGVTLSAALSTESVSGTAASLSTVHVNNHTITDAVFATGTTGALKAADLALVFDSNGSVDVINTTSTNNTVVATIAKTGTATLNPVAVVATSKSGFSLTEAISDFEFTLPGVSNVQVTDLRLTGKTESGFSVFSKLIFTFFGGQGAISAGSTYFQGTIKQTGKVYP
jgi:hypothetical protein